MNAIVISSLSMVLAWPPIAHISGESTTLQGAAVEQVQSADQFLARWKDERNGKLVLGALWTASHSADYPDEKHAGEVLERVHHDVEAISNGDRAAIEPGAIKAFKERLSMLLQDDGQGIRALAAVLLGVCGDKSYASRIAVLLEPRTVTGTLSRFDRGRAAIALGLVGATEYTLDLVNLLKSSNSFDRAGAAFGLGAMRARDQEKAIAQLLNDAEEHVREAAKESLAMMRTGTPFAAGRGRRLDSRSRLDAADRRSRAAQVCPCRVAAAKPGRQYCIETSHTGGCQACSVAARSGALRVRRTSGPVSGDRVPRVSSRNSIRNGRRRHGREHPAPLPGAQPA